MNKPHLFLSALLAMTVAAWLVNLPVSAQASPSASIVVNAAKSIGPVNWRVFGDNVEAADSKHVFGDRTNLLPLLTGTGFWDDQALRPVPSVISMLRDARVTMLRYPGGSLANMYDWHKAVGPVAQRGQWHFGIDEYITTCRAIGAEPQFIVSDYTGTPQDQADLVQYLNSRADAAHPWAQLRARCGHVEPYHVRWFEMGNETDGGGGWPHRQFTAEQYADYVRKTAAAMRAVDPSIKIGIISGTGKPVEDPWNPAVYKLAGPVADFVVAHIYVVGYNDQVSEDRLMRGCMASGDQCDVMLKKYHATIRKALGHDLPLAVTEYNGGFVQEKPVPYRFSFGAALFSADFLRVLLKPENDVLCANYWQAVNGYWGMIKGTGDRWTYEPEYPLRLLWAEHFGTTLLDSAVNAPLARFEGVNGTHAADGPAYRPGKPIPGDLLANLQVSLGQRGPVSWQPAGRGAVNYEFDNAGGNRYEGFATVSAPDVISNGGGTYWFGCDLRANAAPGSGIANYSLGVGDARGWDATHSAAKTPGLPADGRWHHLAGCYTSQSDTRAIGLLLRAEDATTPVTSDVEIKNLTMTCETNEVYPAYPLITSSASKSADGKKVYVIVFNKSNSGDIQVTLQIKGASIGSARFWTVTGPSLASTNVNGITVRETETAVPVPVGRGGTIQHLLPAHSMTAFEIERK